MGQLGVLFQLLRLLPSIRRFVVDHCECQTDDEGVEDRAGVIALGLGELRAEPWVIRVDLLDLISSHLISYTLGKASLMLCVLHLLVVSAIVYHGFCDEFLLVVSTPHFAGSLLLFVFYLQF